MLLTRSVLLFKNYEKNKSMYRKMQDFMMSSDKLELDIYGRLMTSDQETVRMESKGSKPPPTNSAMTSDQGTLRMESKGSKKPPRKTHEAESSTARKSATVKEQAVSSERKKDERAADYKNKKCSAETSKPAGYC